MRTITIALGLAAATLAFTGCKKTTVSPESGGTPLAPRLTYDLIDGAGTTSWFAGNTPADSVYFFSTGGNGIAYRNKVEVFTTNARTYFKNLGAGFFNSNQVYTADRRSYTTTVLLQLNHWDTDTLRTEVYLDAPPNSAVINRLAFYYNNRLSASYDRQSSAAMLDSLYYNGERGLIVPLHKVGHQ